MAHGTTPDRALELGNVKRRSKGIVEKVREVSIDLFGRFFKSAITEETLHLGTEFGLGGLSGNSLD